MYHFHKIFSTLLTRPYIFINIKTNESTCAEKSSKELVTKLKVGCKDVRKFVKTVMIKAGCIPENADSVATVLSMADYRGVFWSGISRLENYYRAVKSGACDGKAMPKIVQETLTTAHINGNNALGPVIADCAMATAIQKAKGVGIGVSSAFGCHHFGMASKYVLDAIQAECIGFAFSNNCPTLIPYGTNKVALGSNQLSVGCPGNCGDHFVLNASTTNFPVERIEYHKKVGLPIPVGWAMTEKGESEVDIDKILAHPKLIPMGGPYDQQGYKGYALSLAVEMLTGILAGGAQGSEHKAYGNHTKKPNYGLTFIAINPDMFACGTTDRMQTLMDYLRNMSPVSPKEPVLVPGDLEREHMKAVDKANGIPYHPAIIDITNRLAQELGIEPLKTDFDC